MVIMHHLGLFLKCWMTQIVPIAHSRQHVLSPRSQERLSVVVIWGAQVIHDFSPEYEKNNKIHIVIVI